MYGIMKEKDVKPSSVVRALKEGTSQKKGRGQARIFTC